MYCQRESYDVFGEKSLPNKRLLTGPQKICVLKALLEGNKRQRGIKGRISPQKCRRILHSPHFSTLLWASHEILLPLWTSTGIHRRITSFVTIFWRYYDTYPRNNQISAKPFMAIHVFVVLYRTRHGMMVSTRYLVPGTCYLLCSIIEQPRNELQPHTIFSRSIIFYVEPVSNFVRKNIYYIQ